MANKLINLDLENTSSTSQKTGLENCGLKDGEDIWTRKPDDIEQEEYDEFYKSITKDKNGPMTQSHFIAEGEVSFKSLLFIPNTQASEQLNSYCKATENINLYVRRAFITDDFKDMMPNYLSFVKGVVDSDDLPLNVSRETLQQHKLLKDIKKKLVHQTLDMIKEIPDDEYMKFWKEYSTNIKIGVIEDTANRTRLAKLLRFSSSSGNLTTLADYVERMKDKQEDIYYIAGGSKNEVSSSPLVKRLLEKGYEVLFLTEAVDEYAISSLPEFEDKKFQRLTLTKPSRNTREDLRTLTGPWECEECGDRVPDSTELLSHVRSVHGDSHVSKLFVRHRRSRRVYPFVMLFRHVVSCGVEGCQMFSARNCVLDNCHLDLRHHFEQDHPNLKNEEFTCEEVLWMHQGDFGGDAPTIELRKLGKKKSLKPKTLRRQKMRIRKLGTARGTRRGPNYTKEEIRKGTLLMFSSLKTYKLLRKLDENGRWPCESTNRKHLQYFQCRWGIQDEMFSLYALKLQPMKQSDKNVSLSFDEVELKPQTLYSERFRERIPKAKKAMVAMVRGLGSGHKEPLFYDYDTPMTMELLSDLIIKTEEAGAHVRNVVLDMGNQSLLSRMGVYRGQFTFPHPTRDGEFIAIIPDYPHGLKNLRTNVFKHGVHFDFNGEKHHLSKKHFEELLEKDGKRGEMRMCHKIK